MDDKKWRRGLYRYNQIDQANCSPNKYVCKGRINNAIAPYPRDHLYNVTYYWPWSLDDIKEQYYNSSYPGYYTLRHAYNAYQLTADALQPLMHATHITAQQQPRPHLQQVPELYADQKKFGHSDNSTIMNQKLDEPTPHYKAKLILWLALLFTIVGLVVVVLILTISKMQIIPLSSLESVSRFEGHFLVTEGPLLKFDGRLLQKNSHEFVAHANKIQRQLDIIYRKSDYRLAYLGSEVVQLRFVPTIPALDVMFVLKTRPDLNISVFDFLSVLRNHVRARGFDGNTIDDKSISLESKISKEKYDFSS